MKRVVIPELLDRDAGTQEEIAGTLADLRRVNRWFGGISTTASLIEQVARETGAHELSLLDVGGADGDVANQTAQRLARRGVQMRLVVLDRAWSHLRKDEAGTSAPHALERVVGDALALPFSDNSFDLVGSSLFVHHLEPPQAVAFFREALRVSRVAVLVNDLRRSAVHLGLVYAGFPIYRSRLTRHDAPASVRAAYTMEELRQLLQNAGAANVSASKQYLFRMGMAAWKSSPRAATGSRNSEARMAPHVA